MQNGKISQEAAIKAILAGGIYGFGEYRSSKIDHVRWTDKSTGRALEADMLKHTVEFGNDSVLVGERTAENFVPSEYVPPCKKGEKVLVKFLSLESTRGQLSGTGVLTPVG